MKTVLLSFGLAMCGVRAHATDPGCGWALDESAPHAAYLVYYETERPPARGELTDDQEKQYAADYREFETKDLMPFLTKQFPSAAGRIDLFAYPSENAVAVTFPEDRTPIVASMKSFEKRTLGSAKKVTVIPRDGELREPGRAVDDEPSRSRDFMVFYPSTLDPMADETLFEDLNRKFIARDLKPWLAKTFPEVADRISITPFPHIQALNLRFPEDAIPAVETLRALERAKFETVPGVEVHHQP